MSKNVSKVVYGDRVLIDLTGDSVSPDVMLSGITAHDKSGEVIVGVCTFDSDTKDATATSDEVLKDASCYVGGKKLVGTMPMNGAVEGVLHDKDSVYTIPYGHHDGSGSVQIDPVEKSKIIPSNIRSGISILGVLGSMSDLEGATSQSKEVIPSSSMQVIVPDEGFNYLSQVTVGAIPYAETENFAGGITVTIG